MASTLNAIRDGRKVAGKCRTVNAMMQMHPLQGWCTIRLHNTIQRMNMASMQGHFVGKVKGERWDGWRLQVMKTQHQRQAKEESAQTFFVLSNPGPNGGEGTSAERRLFGNTGVDIPAQRGSG